MSPKTLADSRMICGSGFCDCLGMMALFGVVLLPFVDALIACLLFATVRADGKLDGSSATKRADFTCLNEV
jgi:hypothetical protein